MTEIDPNIEAPGEEIIAGPDPGYRWKHLILAILAIALGGWFAYDGWVNWPRQNQMAAKLERDLEIAQRNTSSSGDAEKQRLATELRKYEKHNDASILLQKILATVLPAFGIFWGVWTIKDTRGRYRLSSNMLHVPGHPPVPLNDIRRIDKRKWDRKGVAFVHYEHGSPPQPGILKNNEYEPVAKA